MANLSHLELAETCQASFGGNMKYILLLIPCLAALAVPFYNSVEPQLFGFPFFYWFNLLMIPVSMLFIYAASKVGDAS